MAERERQERLREAAALGDAEEVRRLVELGVGLNSQNEVNGWTCLHWACKRNHVAVVAYLLHAGADKDILTKKGERPAQLTSKREIRKMLGVEDELPDLKQDSDLPIIPNYLANPPFPYVYNTLSTSIPDPPLNGNVSHLEPQDTNSPCVPDSDTYGQARAPLQPGNAAPEAPPSRDIPPLSRGSAGPSHPNPVLQRAPVYQGSVSWGRSPSLPAGSNQSLPQQGSSSCMGPVPAFQPVFFTGAFPLNMQELVLKVRIQTPNLRENDFIEIELDRQELTYKELLRVSCRELGVNPELVQKIRKLPNTMLRKDKDVARLQDFQELELVLTSSEPEQCPCSCWGSPGLCLCLELGTSRASVCRGLWQVRDRGMSPECPEGWSTGTAQGHHTRGSSQPSRGSTHIPNSKFSVCPGTTLKLSLPR